MALNVNVNSMITMTVIRFKRTSNKRKSLGTIFKNVLLVRMQQTRLSA